MSPLTPSQPKPTPNRQPQARPGFSLIELMVVMVIIGILLALLLPAINNVTTGTQTAQIKVEIEKMAQGVAEFKTQYGQEPPSGIILSEAGGAWDTQSTIAIQTMWPQFDFTIDRDLDDDGTAGEADPDGDGNPGMKLTGDECLVFFLGGVDTLGPTADAVADGFSSNPSDPFSSGGNRVAAFVEFDPDRFVDTDGDGANSYTDIYEDTTVPYLYLSSYNGRRYRVLNDADIDNNGVPELYLSIDSDGNGTEDEQGYAVYMQKDPNSLIPNSSTSTPEDGEVAWNKNGFQIICAGADGEFGCGGIWSDDDGISFNFGSGEEVLNVRAAADNITNFSSGTLE